MTATSGTSTPRATASTGAAVFDPASGTLRASAADLRSLVATPLPATGPLVVSGAVVRGQVHPALAPTLEALRAPRAGVLQLSYRGRALDGWRGADTVAVLTPADTDGLHTLVRVNPPLLGAALVKVARLRDRPTAPRALPTVELARSPDIVRWWRLLHRPTGSSTGGLLEVVDTHHGLYLALDNGLAIPTDALAVHHLLRWLLDGGRTMPPLRALPRGVLLPQPA